MWKWIARHHGEASGIEMKPVASFGRGIVSSENFVKGEEVAIVNRKCIMRASLTIRESKHCAMLYEVWTGDKSGNIMKQKSHQTVEKALISIFLLEEKLKGKSSFFHPYIDMLPPTVEYVPVTWTAVEVENWFQGSYMVQAIRNRRSEFHSEFHEGVLSVLPQLRHRRGFAFEDFVWARIILATRAFRIYMNGALEESEEKTMSANSQIALVPIADLLNHKKRPQTEWTFNVDLNAFTLTATTDIPSNTPVYDSYGDKSNFEFLLNFGFTTDDGRKNLHFTITKDDLHLADQPEWIASANEKKSMASRTPVINLAEGGGGKRINILDIPYLKKYVLSDSVDRHFLALVAYLRKEGELHEVWRDRTADFAMKVISRKLEMVQKSYATTLEQDEHIYDNMGFSSQKLLMNNPYKKFVHALKLRMEEKNNEKDFKHLHQKYQVSELFPACLRCCHSGSPNSEWSSYSTEQFYHHSK